jgi:hypothetical protein
MKLWRLTRAAHTALDGAGTLRHGGRYSPPGVPVVNFASEAGLAVLVALRYLPGDPAEVPDDYLLGWTEIDAAPERVPDDQGEEAIRAYVTRWLEERRSLLAAVRSRVLPEADVVLMNPAHWDAARVPPLATRPFSFAECSQTGGFASTKRGSGNQGAAAGTASLKSFLIRDRCRKARQQSAQTTYLPVRNLRTSRKGVHGSPAA